MNLFKNGQVVHYRGIKWIVTGITSDPYGNDLYYLQRGDFHTLVNEAEVSE